MLDGWNGSDRIMSIDFAAQYHSATGIWILALMCGNRPASFLLVGLPMILLAVGEHRCLEAHPTSQRMLLPVESKVSTLWHERYLD